MAHKKFSEADLARQFNAVAAFLKEAEEGNDFEDYDVAVDAFCLEFSLLMKLCQKDDAKGDWVARFADIIIDSIEGGEETAGCFTKTDDEDDKSPCPLQKMGDALCAAGQDYLPEDFPERLNQLALLKMEKFRGDDGTFDDYEEAKIIAEIAARAGVLLSQRPKISAALPHDVPVTTPLTQKPRKPQ